MNKNKEELDQLSSILSVIVEAHEIYEANYNLVLNGTNYPLNIYYDTEINDVVKNPNKLISPFLNISIKGREDTVRSIMIDHHDFQASMNTVNKAIYSEDFITSLVDQQCKENDKLNELIEPVSTSNTLTDKQIIQFWEKIFDSKKDKVLNLTTRVANTISNSEDIIKNLNSLCENSDRKVIKANLIQFLAKEKIADKEDLYYINEKGNNIGTQKFNLMFNQVKPNNLSKLQQCNLVDQFVNFLALNEFDKQLRISNENKMNRSAELIALNPIETLINETNRLSKEIENNEKKKVKFN